jgi:TonB-dependent receptor
MGGDFRELPQIISENADDKRLAPRGIDPTQGFTYDTLSEFGQSFRNIWSSSDMKALPNGSLAQSYGNEFKLLGRSLGVVQSFNYSRETHRTDNELMREYRSYSPRLDYIVDRTTESVQLGGLAALSYRLTPAHTLTARTVYTRSADDETRLEEGYYEDIDGTLRDTRLKYTERSVLTGVLGGRHDFRSVLGSKIDWKLSGSAADWLQPDRRETIYQQISYVDDNDEVVTDWAMLSVSGGGASREFGAQEDRGWGFDGSWSVPLRYGGLGRGKVDLGFGYQTKDRDYEYRRFIFRPAGTGNASPESLFQESRWLPNSTGARIQDNTFPDDYYEGEQEQTAGFASFDVPLGARLRAVLGLRVEHATQYVRSYDPFTGATASTADLDDVDWLPSANLTWGVNDRTNLRLAASRTLSRPDLRELSPSRDFDHPGGYVVFGEPGLVRSRLDNYDARLETFPSHGEVFAIGGFYKRLYQPIEMVFRPGDQPQLSPLNSEGGTNMGLEFEARTSLGRFSDRLQRFFLNANYSVIDSRVELPATTTQYSGLEHPLAGQAAHSVNASVQYTSGGGRFDVAVLFGRTGRRLRIVGLAQPDVYVEAQNTLDANINWGFAPAWKMKLAATGILKEPYRERQGAFITREYVERAGYSIGVSYAPF